MNCENEIVNMGFLWQAIFRICFDVLLFLAEFETEPLVACYLLLTTPIQAQG